MELLTETSGGIYAIRNLDNGKTYIGQTRNFKERSNSHYYLLRNNEHYNVDLQIDYNHGARLCMEVIEVVNKEDFNELSRLEACYIYEHDSIKNGYNVFAPSLDMLIYLIKMHYIKPSKTPLPEFGRDDFTLGNYLDIIQGKNEYLFSIYLTAKNNVFPIQLSDNLPFNKLITLTFWRDYIIVSITQNINNLQILVRWNKTQLASIRKDPSQ